MRRWREVVAAATLVIGLAAPAKAAYLEDAGWGALTVLSDYNDWANISLATGLGDVDGKPLADQIVVDCDNPARPRNVPKEIQP